MEPNHHDHIGHDRCVQGREHAVRCALVRRRLITFRPQSTCLGRQESHSRSAALGQIPREFKLVSPALGGISGYYNRAPGRDREEQHLIPGAGDSEVQSVNIRTIRPAWPCGPGPCQLNVYRCASPAPSRERTRREGVRVHRPQPLVRPCQRLSLLSRPCIRDMTNSGRFPAKVSISAHPVAIN